MITCTNNQIGNKEYLSWTAARSKIVGKICVFTSYFPLQLFNIYIYIYYIYIYYIYILCIYIYFYLLLIILLTWHIFISNLTQTPWNWHFLQILLFQKKEIKLKYCFLTIYSDLLSKDHLQRWTLKDGP